MTKVSRIFLVGFMGAGKTTVGKILADRLGWTFVDLDAEIEAYEGRSVEEIFRTDGEAYFRRRERERLGKAAAGAPAVISLGGGAYADAENRDLVDAQGLSVYLEAPLGVLIDRIGEGRGRPLASDRAHLERLFVLRGPSYRMASMTITTEGRSPEEISDAVVRGVAAR